VNGAVKKRAGQESLEEVGRAVAQNRAVVTQWEKRSNGTQSQPGDKT